MDENKVLENLSLNSKSANRIELLIVLIFSVLFISSVTLFVLDYNPFIAKFETDTKVIGEILEKRNEVKIKRFGEIAWRSIDKSVYENSTIMTGVGSSATIKIEDQIIKLASNSLIDFKKKDSKDTLVNIQEGNLEVKGHAKKLSFAVNDQEVKSTDRASQFVINKKNPKALEIKSGALNYKSGGETLKLDKNSEVLKKPAFSNSDILLRSPLKNEEITGLPQKVNFRWTGSKNNKVILQLASDPNYQNILNEIKLERSFYRLTINEAGKYYWRVFAENLGADGSPEGSFILKSLGSVNWKLPKRPVLSKSDYLIIENKTPAEVHLEISRSPSFKVVDKKIEIKKGARKARLNYLGKKYIRVIDSESRVLKKPVALEVTPAKGKHFTSSTQEFNDMKVGWRDILKNIPDLFYVVRIEGKGGFKRNYDAVNPELKFKLPQDGEYNVSLYAKGKNTKGLLLDRKKIKYKRVKAPSLKKEIIIR